MLAHAAQFERIGFHVPPQPKESPPGDCRVTMIFQCRRIAGESGLLRKTAKNKTGATRCSHSRGAWISLAIARHHDSYHGRIWSETGKNISTASLKNKVPDLS